MSAEPFVKKTKNYSEMKKSLKISFSLAKVMSKLNRGGYADRL